MSKIGSFARARASSSQVYPGGKFYLHFASGFHFRYSLRLPFAAVLPVLKRLMDIRIKIWHFPSLKTFIFGCTTNAVVFLFLM